MKHYALIAAVVVLGGSLAGCSGSSGDPAASKKVVAKVNGEEITEGDFYTRLLNVTAPDLAPALPGMSARGPSGAGRAGEFAIQSMVGQRMILQLAKQKNAIPTDAEINAYITFAKKYRDPRYTMMPEDPYRSDDDWRKEARTAMCFRKMALAQSPVKENDLQAKYAQLKNQLKEQDQYHLRLIDIADKAKAEKSLGKLQKGVPFETVALTDSEDPMSATRNGEVGFVPGPQLQQYMPNLSAEIKKLKPGEYTKQVVGDKLPPRGANAAAPGQQLAMRYFLAQLVEMKAGRTPTFEEVRPIIELACLQEKDPGAYQRIQTQLSDFRDKAKIEIFLKPYEHLMDKPKTSATGGAPAPGAAPAPGKP